MQRLSRAPDIPKELPGSTLNDILNGKRERLPDWELVVSFVMVCRSHAERTGLPTGPLGTVEQWQVRWRAARTERFRPPATGSYDLFRTPADEAERRTTRTVARLVRRAGDGEAEPAYRLAIIHVLTGESAQARYWIHAAIQQRHPDARAFADHPRPTEFAAQLSFSYGQAYEQEGPAKRDIARFYYRLAADHGHPRAAERLRALRAVPFGKLLPAPVATEAESRPT
jgi:TPR repeat protein